VEGASAAPGPADVGRPLVGGERHEEVPGTGGESARLVDLRSLLGEGPGRRDDGKQQSENQESPMIGQALKGKGRIWPS